MDLRERLQKHMEDVKKLYPNALWYGQKTDMQDIDDAGAIMTYTSENHSADANPHFSIVTLTLYLTNHPENSYELIHLLGYSNVDEPAIDIKFNYTATLQKRVVVL